MDQITDTQKIGHSQAMSKGATTPKEIATAIGKSDEAVRQALQRMLAQRRVYRHEYGKYILPAWTETPQFFLEHPITPVTPHSSPS